MASPTTPLTLPNTHPTEIRPTQQPSNGLPNSYAALPNSVAGLGVRPRGERIEGIVQTVIMLAIGGAAGAASFRHVHDVAAAHGQPGWLAWADAVILELASIAAGFEIRRRKRRNKPVGFPATTLTVAVALSLAAQVVEAEASVIGWIAAALPALGFLAMVKMAMSRADTTGVPDTTATTQVGSWTVPDKQPLAADTTGHVPDEPHPVADTTGSVQDRRGRSPDVTALVPAAREAAEALITQDIPLNRTTLATHLRTEGHQLSTAAATALVRMLRTEAANGPSTHAQEIP
jgi:hypothetical protein